MADNKEQEFLERLSQLLGGAELAPDMKLDELEAWDSLAGVDFMGMADTEYGRDIDPMSLRMAYTVHDLYELACGQAED